MCCYSVQRCLPNAFTILAGVLAQFSEVSPSPQYGYISADTYIRARPILTGPQPARCAIVPSPIHIEFPNASRSGLMSPGLFHLYFKRPKPPILVWGLARSNPLILSVGPDTTQSTPFECGAGNRPIHSFGMWGAEVLEQHFFKSLRTYAPTTGSWFLAKPPWDGRLPRVESHHVIRSTRGNVQNKLEIYLHDFINFMFSSSFRGFIILFSFL